MAVVLTDAQKAKLVKVEQLVTFKSLADNKYQDKTLADGTQSSFTSATTVEAALIELASKAAGDEISFERLVTPNTNKLATYRFTKGTGVSATTMDIDIEKDLVNKNFQLVSITEGTDENAGKYFDGVTEVGSSVGVTGPGVYMKYITYASGSATETVSYADMSGVIEYLTVGTQTGKAVTLSIVNHQITADIAEKAIQKSHLSQSVQDSLDLADSALQQHQDISGKADKVTYDDFSTSENYSVGDIVKYDNVLYKCIDAHTAGAWNAEHFTAVSGDLVATIGNDGNLKASSYKVSDFKTKQTAVADIAEGSAAAETGSTMYFLSGITQNANGEISATKKKIGIANDDDIRAIFGLDPESNS